MSSQGPLDIQRVIVDQWERSMREREAAALTGDDGLERDATAGGGGGETVRDGAGFSKRRKDPRLNAGQMNFTDFDLREDTLNTRKTEVKNKHRSVILALRDKRNQSDPKSLQARYSGLDLHKDIYKSKSDERTREESFLRLTLVPKRGGDNADDDAETKDKEDELANAVNNNMRISNSRFTETSMDGSRNGINNVSKKFLKERRENKHKITQEFNAKIFEEAINIQREILTCIEEANVFAALLRLPYRFSQSKKGRDEAEDRLWARLIEAPGPQSGIKESWLPPKTGERIKNTLVEAFDISTNEPRECFTVGEFFREHQRLRNQVKKSQSLIPSTDETQAGAKGRNRAIPSARPASTPVSGGIDLMRHMQRLLENTIEQSEIIEKQAAAIKQCRWNVLR